MADQFKILPDIGTPEEAKNKMKDAYLSYLDSAAKFVTLAEYYTDVNNKDKPTNANFINRYNFNFNKLKNSQSSDYVYSMSYFTIIPLTYIEELKENLDDYSRLLDHEDKDLSDYDKACDYLTVRDEFKDLERALNRENKRIAENRDAMTHFNDSKYDPNTIKPLD